MDDFAPSPANLVERFAAVAADMPEAERRQMFGYPSLFVGGNLVAGLHKTSWFVRLGEPERAELLAWDGARPLEVMPGRVMSGYVVMPDAIVADEAALRRWVERAIAFGQTLPPKAAKASKATKSKRA